MIPELKEKVYIMMYNNSEGGGTQGRIQTFYLEGSPNNNTLPAFEPPNAPQWGGGGGGGVALVPFSQCLFSCKPFTEIFLRNFALTGSGVSLDT